MQFIYLLLVFFSDHIFLPKVAVLSNNSFKRKLIFIWA